MTDPPRLRIAPSKGKDEQVVYVTAAASLALRDLRMMQQALDQSGADGDFGLMRPAPSDQRIFRLGAAQIGQTH